MKLKECKSDLAINGGTVVFFEPVDVIRRYL